MPPTTAVRLVTEIPGPQSRAVLARLGASVARAVSPSVPVVVDHAQGALLTDVDGNTFIDFTGGVGVLNVGHAHPAVVAAVKTQTDRFLHTDFSVVPYASYIELAERLAARFPGGGPARVAFFNSGAEAVENAVKIARLATGRKALVAFEGAFHGRTYMALSLTYKTRPYKAGFGPFVPDVYRVPYPYPYRCPWGSAGHPCGGPDYAALTEALTHQVAPDDVAAVIVEPVLGEGGFVVPPPDFLPWLRRFTAQHGILLIADEVQTGFGRTGRFFACEHAGVVPDLLVFAKSVADGLPLSGVMGPPAVMDRPDPGQLGGTYVGNPLAVAAAHAVLDVFEQEDLLARARRQGEILQTRLGQLAGRDPRIGEVRGLGAMVGMELVQDRTTRRPDADLADRLVREALRRGLLLLRAGVAHNVIRFLAPLVTPEAVLEEGLAILADALAAV
ncbi:MAG: 4-aminobutyrate--2-oxoglutarate transaminase [Actinomycetia bacterium]|nr:4-aminobutyrate--2-oxoglutarate transaminase [Actinomycetes bacterium]